jgi:hypothetical protein
MTGTATLDTRVYFDDNRNMEGIVPDIAQDDFIRITEEFIARWEQTPTNEALDDSPSELLEADCLPCLLDDWKGDTTDD